MSAWDGEAPDVEQRVAFVIVARSPIERLVAFKKERGWTQHRLYSDTSGDFTPRLRQRGRCGRRPGFNVFTRRDGTIRHFWCGEMGPSTADPGQDPRGAPDLDAAVDHSGHHARRPRQGLVSAVELLNVAQSWPGSRLIAGNFRNNSHRFWHAQHLSAFNPHLTKSRLNDAPCLCETALGTFWGRHQRGT